MKFESMRILLTGATGGIGHQLASQLLHAGASVLLHGRSEDRLNKLVSQLGMTHSKCRTVSGDLVKKADREKIALAAESFSVNVLINNAGISEFKLFEDTDIESIVDVNITGTLLLSQAVLPSLTTKPEALIVNIGSTFGAIGFPGYVAYCATKHALKGFSEALYRELTDSRVDVLYVAPRATATSMNSDAANAVNEALGTSTDSPELVATAVMLSIRRKLLRQQLGWPEKMQVKLNALFPSVVDFALARQLNIIREFATIDH